MSVFLSGVWGWLEAGRLQPAAAEAAQPRCLSWAPVGAAVAIVLGLALYAPLSDALVIGGDDMFELGKAQLLHRHPDLAVRLDNDQPWLHTLLVSWLFGWLGENAAIPRLFSLGCALVLAWSCFGLLGRGAGALERFFFLAFFFTSTQVPTLAASAMLELPAFAIGTCAAAVTLGCRRGNAAWRAGLAGALFMAAVNIKLTVLLILPAWAVAAWWGRRARVRIPAVAAWAAGAVVAGLAIAWISPTFSLEDLWLRHWQARNTALVHGELAPVWGDVVNDLTVFIAVIWGVGRLAARGWRREPGLLFALGWLVTALLVHGFHRPWWSFYALHFHVPVAILAAEGVGGMARRAWADLRGFRRSVAEPPATQGAAAGGKRRGRSGFSLAAVAAITVCSGWYGFRLPATFDELHRIGSARTARANVFVGEIRKYASRASWLYSSDPQIVFHSGIPQPPELVLTTYKRFALHRIDQEHVMRVLQEYRPEVLLLGTYAELRDPVFRAWLQEQRYVRVFWTTNEELWVAESLAPKSVRTPRDLIRDLGL
ncbi:MAG: hypothetical protein D6766_08565 [Verrucomicrobia bacterium]|nr:MAG: hypothetical protein D6766_08565 [Verrucomicrobiota bacterium]